MTSLINRQLTQRRQELTWLEKQLQRPDQHLREQAQRLDDLEQRLITRQKHQSRDRYRQLAVVTAQLQALSPKQRLQELSLRLNSLSKRQHTAKNNLIKIKRQQLESMARTLDTVSPLATLGRGYSIVYTLPKHTIICDAEDVSAGDKIEARLAKGRLLCKVEDTLDE
jgi:exodeoxyribonuclease VII large subunit